MEDSGLATNAILNAASVWFIFKAIEVIAFVPFDIQSLFVKILRNRGNPGPSPCESKFKRCRAKVQYVLSGNGFLNPDLCQQRKIPLLLVSTILPVAVFVLELLSISLGNEKIICKTSADPNVITSPSLVLFGEGRPQNNSDGTVFDETRDLARPCVSWSSTHAGVDFLSSLCGDSLQSTDHVLSRGFSLPAGVFLRKDMGNLPPGHLRIYNVYGYALQSETSLVNPRFLGSFRFHSGVTVNGKSFLVQDVFTGGQIRQEQKNKLIREFRVLERFGNVFPGTYLEDEKYFGIVWDNATYYRLGAVSMVQAVLRQVTREPIKTAAEMSIWNTLEFGSELKTMDISCGEEFRLPRTASIIIIVVAVICRFILIFVRSAQFSVENALETSKEASKEESEASP